MNTPGRLAFVGSGEYLPVMQDIEAWLLEDRPRRYVQLATAAAPEGDASLQRWFHLGAESARRLDAEQVVVDVRVRSDAENPVLADLISGAGLIYLSGGNPSHLARTLRDTLVWSAITDAWRSGASLAGCSAGAMAMGGYVPDIRHPKQGGVDGLGVVPQLRVLPHFDRFSKMIPDFVMRPLLTPEATVVGIDEDTALVSEGPAEDGLWEFRSRGRQSVWRIDEDRRHRVNSPLRLRVDA
ncbi:MAG: Type 1 glutamine amidotransferase-like domain-containing protein [Actinobacteria bacterium]|jgi:cyanophycinase-like exopeptidase|nr:Type 1 glutamine amidotransferase-like domain-containing protein [Actinomycetota bacterium]